MYTICIRMRTNTHYIDRILVFLIVIAVILPILSWMLSAFGVHCNSMLSGDGWRWLFLNFPGCAVNRYSLYFAAFLVMVGALQQCGIFRKGALEHTVAFGMSFASGLVLLSLLGFAAFYPQSPLLSITGGFYHSALLYGLPFALSLIGVAIASVYGIISGNVSTFRSFSDMLTWGVSHNIKLLVIFLQLEFISQCLKYLFNS